MSCWIYWFFSFFAYLSDINLLVTSSNGMGRRVFDIVDKSIMHIAKWLMAPELHYLRHHIIRDEAMYVITTNYSLDILDWQQMSSTVYHICVKSLRPRYLCMYVLTLIQKMIWVEVSTGTFLETTLTVGTSQNIPEIEVFFYTCNFQWQYGIDIFINGIHHIYFFDCLSVHVKVWIHLISI